MSQSCDILAYLPPRRSGADSHGGDNALRFDAGPPTLASLPMPTSNKTHAAERTMEKGLSVGSRGGRSDPQAQRAGAVC